MNKYIITLLVASMGILSLYARSRNEDTLLTTNSCVGCDLTRANLRNAHLTDANLTNADLTGANLTGANLRGTNLTDANLTNVICNANTVLPIGFLCTAHRVFELGIA